MKLLSWQPGIAAGLTSAVLFGAGTPLAKSLLGDIDPWMLAGLLYLGSGLGLWLYRRARGVARPRMNPGELRWLAAAVACGGGLAPVLLMFGLSAMQASHVSLLLNAEAVLTALLAWGLFRENVDRRIAVGMGAIVAGALLLSWPSGAAQSADTVGLWPALAVVLACLFWALDNNFTRKVALNDASWIACVKGLAAGTTNLGLAFIAGASLPPPGRLAAAMAVGFFCLRREPGTFHRRAAAPGCVEIGCVLLHGSLRRRADRSRVSRRGGHVAARGGCAAHGVGVVAAHDRTPCPQPSPRADGA